MTDWFGGASTSPREQAERTIAEAVRRVKLEARNDPAFVPPGDDLSNILAARQFVLPPVIPPTSPEDRDSVLASRIFNRPAASTTSVSISDTSTILAARVFLRGTVSTGGGGGHRLTFGTHLTGGSFDGSSDVTLATDATNLNTASTIVARDASGNFVAGTISANLTGNASGTAATVTSAVQAAITSTGTLTALVLGSGVAPSFANTGGAATAGTLTMVLGTKTVNTTAATATCLIFFQRVTVGGTIGFATTYTVVAGTSFTVSSDSALDTSIYAWHIIETH